LLLFSTDENARQFYFLGYSTDEVKNVGVRVSPTPEVCDTSDGVDACLCKKVLPFVVASNLLSCFIFPSGDENFLQEYFCFGASLPEDTLQ